MTPEERAVIDAAQAWYQEYVDTGTRSPQRLWDAVGDLLGHGQPQLQWYARTWVDVRPGDRIRMSGVEARVLSVTPLHWHVHPATGTGPGNPPVAHEHTLISYRLAAPYDRQLYQIQPTAPVEIQLEVREHEHITMNYEGEEGWRDRRGVKNS